MKEVERRPKYPELMKEEFYQIHANPPFDVAVWYQQAISRRPSDASSVATPIEHRHHSDLLASPMSSRTLSPMEDNLSLASYQPHGSSNELVETCADGEQAGEVDKSNFSSGYISDSSPNSMRSSPILDRSLPGSFSERRPLKPQVTIT
ncbi:hypothetical protein Ciccas_011094 [Cichlidogyrus casuarinus]|uniref:Uncharacterized protein n=1 Tax=Cichlidogyrus casuarinus TaxID=1844966 RepID=A0ABD2PTE5_9PLAT